MVRLIACDCVRARARESTFCASILSCGECAFASCAFARVTAAARAIRRRSVSEATIGLKRAILKIASRTTRAASTSAFRSSCSRSALRGHLASLTHAAIVPPLSMRRTANLHAARDTP
eukprot:7390727-Prymnesium_polylepis.2